MAYHADAFAAVVMISHGSLGGGLCACVDFKRSNMSLSSSIQACLEFASAFRTSSGFATDSSGGRFPCADGSERRQFEVIEVRGRHGVTETSGVRCVCCSTDEKPFTWPKMKLDALLRNLRHHAGHTTRRGSKTHLRALFVNSGLPLPRVLSALAHPGKRPGRRGPMPGTLPKKRPRKDPDEEPTVEYTPRLSSARRRAKRCGKVSRLPAVFARAESIASIARKFHFRAGRRRRRGRGAALRRRGDGRARRRAERGGVRRRRRAPDGPQ